MQLLSMKNIDANSDRREMIPQIQKIESLSI